MTPPPRFSARIRTRIRHGFPCGLAAALVLVRTVAETPVPSLTIAAPRSHQVVQRLHPAGTAIKIVGSLSRPAESGDRLEVSWESPKDSQPVPVPIAHLSAGQTAFEHDLWLPAGGWYRLRFQWSGSAREPVASGVDAVGVGEVFLVAGQSNAANHGESRQKPGSDRVVAWDGTRWRVAEDPQPGASGGAGSFMPALGDRLVQAWDVPIGFIPVAEGATSVREWLPKDTPLPNPPTLLGNVVQEPGSTWRSRGALFDRLISRGRSLGNPGFRAVLWHQGESDANQADPTRTLSGPDYLRLLSDLIRASRREWGWETPWFVAQASYHTPEDTGSPSIRKAQAESVRLGLALAGPDTDALTGRFRDLDGRGVHFSAEGLQAHGKLWAEKLLPCWNSRFAEEEKVPVSGPQPAAPRRESRIVAGRPGFVLLPEASLRRIPQPWVFYAPTLRGLPDLHEQWLFTRLLESGIAIAGLDVGEAYGNPVSQELFGRFASNLAERDGFARRPCLLGRSRGGLAVAAWAASEPSRASGIAGIYPVFDLRSYPGTDKAAAAYGRAADELGAPGSIWNPVNRLDAVARGGVPAYLVHGDSDTVVPIGANSAAFAEAYRRTGRSDAVQLEVLPGQGHNFFPGFFRSPGLLRFLTERAKAGALP